MRKPTFCICKIKDADQLHGNHKADQRLCFRYMDSTIPLLSKSKFSSLQPSSGLVQLGLCQTCSETTLLVFPRDGSYMSRRLMGKPTICVGENKDADQLRGNREADQRLCCRYLDSTIPPLLNSKISSF